MPTFNNIKSLESFLRTSVNSVLENEVAEITKIVMQANEDDVVYSSYSPKVYERRYMNGGLEDIDNISSELVSDGVLYLRNETKVNDAYGGITNGMLDEVIISGEGYAYGNGDEPYFQSRDFYSATEQDLKNGILVNTLKKALKSRGIKSI